jgi:carbamoyltransferase
MDDKGEILFAEATERFLQYKRAVNCEPDTVTRMPDLLAEFLEPDCEVVVATSWADQYADFLNRSAHVGQFDIDSIIGLTPELNRSLTPTKAERALIGQLHVAQRRAGLGVLIGLDRAFGHTRMSLRRYQHHETHAAYACYTSPFDEAVCLIVDGMGETGSIATYDYKGGRVSEVRRHRGRESLGFLFGLLTDICGFDQSKGEEWKVMGLAPYGKRDQRMYDIIRKTYDFKNGRLKFKDEATIRAAYKELADTVHIKDSNSLEARDLARTGQDIFEEIMADILGDVEARDLSKNLVLGGGCALNSSYNGKLLAGSTFEKLFVPSAPADDGNALGAAMMAFYEDNEKAKPTPGFQSPYLGSSVDTKPIQRIVQMGWGGNISHLPKSVAAEAAQRLADGQLIGWVQGRAEFGPRALGNRSILADARPADAKDKINAKVKYREAFRPFAPSILHEHGAEWFEDYQESPYMERTLKFKPNMRDKVPAVVHADGTGRLQSVKREWNQRYYDLISAFNALTGVPLILNTSFNIMGKPILHSAEDALQMLHTTGLDAVIIEDWLISK